MAKASGLSATTVGRARRAFGLQPHRAETFKLSTDPLFAEKVRDIVGLYLAPLFCGEAHFRHALPLDRSSTTRWRQRLGPERLEPLLAETLAAAQKSGALQERHLRRMTIDTTVQPEAVTHPADRRQAAPPRHRGPGAPRPAARGPAAAALHAGGEEGSA